MKKNGIASTMTMLATFAANASTANLSDIELLDHHNRTQITNVAMQKADLRGSSIFFEDFQTQVDPQNPTMPAGWTLFNVDGLTPAESVSYVIDAWIAREPVVGDIKAWSTSWYAPEGIADDWMITPQITLTSNNNLSWLAFASDINFPDGYEVYVSTTTPDVAGCQAGGIIFTIPEEQSTETSRQVNLSAVGFMDQDVYICFRNNSNRKHLLILDDIRVYDNSLNDLRIDAISAPPEYTQAPELLGSFDIPLSVDFTNAGILDQSNVTVNAEIILDGISQTTISQVVAGPIAANASESLSLGNFSASEIGVYDVIYSLELDGAIDGVPDDNTQPILNAITITNDTMSRDDDTIRGSLGIGLGNGGHIGNMFEFSTPVTLTGVNFVYSNDNCDANPPNACSLDGESIQVDVFEIDSNTGLPDMMIASTEAHIVPSGIAQDTSVIANFTNTLALNAGQYVFAVTEPVRTVSTFDSINLQLNYSNSRFTVGATWVNWPTIPNGQWSNSEEFGFLVAYFIRPQFLGDLIFENDFE